MARAFAAASLVLLLSLVLLHLVNDSHQLPIGVYAPAPSPSAPPGKIDCPAECSTRCKESKRPNLCKRACGSCCKECNCVPPSTYGNYEACPCYFNIKTHNQTRKCP